MRTTSLRWRLLAGGSLAIAAALALAWIGMALIFARHIEQQAAEDLQRQGAALVAELRSTPSGPFLGHEPADPRFAAPASGLYWQATTAAGQLRSRSLWEAALPAVDAPADRWRRHIVGGPFGERMLILGRTVRPQPGAPAVATELGFDLGRLEPARRAFGRDLALFLLLLWIVLSSAAWIQVTLGLRPLRLIRGEMDRLRCDPAARLGGRYPTEVAPLAGAVDALAEARERDLARARRRAADLAHSLKTPLAALAAQSRRAREAGADKAADGLDRAIAAVRGAVEAELARARIGLAETGRCAVAPLVEGLIRVIERTEAGERLAFVVDVLDDRHVPLSTEDAAELFGPLLENAARHARRLVRVTGADASTTDIIVIEDDGAGMDVERYDQAVLRGERLDSGGGGHGLGLAISREMAEASGGCLRLGPSPLGGLAVTVDWPRSTPDFPR